MELKFVDGIVQVSSDISSNRTFYGIEIRDEGFFNSDSNKVLIAPFMELK